MYGITEKYADEVKEHACHSATQPQMEFYFYIYNVAEVYTLNECLSFVFAVTCLVCLLVH